jgi:predicted TPR repeat methyltransferase
VTDYWNHNTHYHPLILAAMPARCRNALDVGCGDGLLARKLADRSARVTGVDQSAEMIRLAESGPEKANVTYQEAAFPEGVNGPYDFISAVAVIHHMEFAKAVTAMRDLLNPGGRLVIVGLANNHSAWDWIVSAAGVPATQINGRLRREHAPEGMPIKDPGMTWAEVRRSADRLLPGCRYRRHLYWRYSITWEKAHGPLAG